MNDAVDIDRMQAVDAAAHKGFDFTGTLGFPYCRPVRCCLIKYQGHYFKLFTMPTFRSQLLILTTS